MTDSLTEGTSPVPETNTYRFNVTVEIDVTNAETESEAREKAFAVMSTIPVARGRKASGPKAAITGVSIKPQAAPQQFFFDATRIDLDTKPSATDVTE